MRARIQGSQEWDYVVDIVCFPIAPRVLHLQQVMHSHTMYGRGQGLVEASAEQVESLPECLDCQGFASTSHSGARSIRELVARCGVTDVEASRGGGQ